jgi:hypothetical protein
MWLKPLFNYSTKFLNKYYLKKLIYSILYDNFVNYKSNIPIQVIYKL